MLGLAICALAGFACSAAGDESPALHDQQPAASPDRPLVGVSYFAGWWPEAPNKWQTPGTGVDWRERFPARRPLLGEYNDQKTIDAEILAAADHGVDFFAILWYPPSTRSKESPMLARGLSGFLASPNAGRLRFFIEFCNHPPFTTATEEEWENCIRAWMPALRHASYLRVGGRLVFKVHSAGQFWADTGEKLDVAQARLGRLRQAARDAGLGEMVIGAGGVGPLAPGSWPVKLFEFSGDYMDVPPLPVTEADRPFAELADFLHNLRVDRSRNAVPYLPVLAAGWNPRPWRDPRPSFAFPTRQQWTDDLRRIRDDLRATPSLGIPRADGAVEKAFMIYAWNEFGEGGYIAPTHGDQRMKLEAIREVFGLQRGEK